MQYAIIADGGKQYKAVVGGTIEVDYFAAEIGDQLDLPNVLLIRSEDEIMVGKPHVEGAVVQATVVAQVKGPKIVVFKYKPQNRYRVKSGHRQKYTRLQIDSITTDNGKK